MNFEAMRQHFGSEAGQTSPGLWDRFTNGFQHYQAGLRNRLSGQQGAMTGLFDLIGMNPANKAFNLTSGLQQLGMNQGNVMPMNRQYGNYSGVTPYRSSNNFSVY